MSDCKTVEERLHDLLNEAESKIEKLEEKLDDRNYHDDWHWRQIRQLSEEENLDLPIPRMEIRYRKDDYNAYADYGLVIRHMLKHIDFIPLSSTRVSKEYADSLSLPHRDGAHIIHDKGNLDLPAYVIYKDKFKEVDFKHPHERTNH